jgi:transcription antitermination factor NusG
VNRKALGNITNATLNELEKKLVVAIKEVYSFKQEKKKRTVQEEAISNVMAGRFHNYIVIQLHMSSNSIITIIGNKVMTNFSSKEESAKSHTPQEATIIMKEKRIQRQKHRNERVGVRFSCES